MIESKVVLFSCEWLSVLRDNASSCSILESILDVQTELDNMHSHAHSPVSLVMRAQDPLTCWLLVHVG